MDMEIPFPEELELLEANYHLHDDCLDFEPAEPYPEEYGKEQPTPSKSPPSIDHPPSYEVRNNAHKRLRSSDGPDESIAENSGLSDEKRSRVDDVDRSENDEDWLYSPPHEIDPVVDQRVTDVVEEKVVSRYASEIDGSFIPVTAPSAGDRVYAKICLVEKERPKKLHVKGTSGGRTKLFS